MSRSQILEVLLDLEIVVFLLLIYAESRDVNILPCEGVTESVRGTQIDHGPALQNFNMTVGFSLIANAEGFLFLV